MQLLYHGKAKKAGVYVVGGCGAPNAPCDLGLHLTKQNFKGKTFHCVKRYVHEGAILPPSPLRQIKIIKIACNHLIRTIGQV